MLIQKRAEFIFLSLSKFITSTALNTKKVQKLEISAFVCVSQTAYTFCP